MAFRLRKDARTWFKEIESQLDSDAPQFDLYYFCLSAGLANGRKEDVPSEETGELVDYFPGEFRSRARIIVAWFLARELKSLGIHMHERAQIHTAIGDLVDPLSLSHLSESGVREMNRYAAGGFDLLTEHFIDRPHNLETFLPAFHSMIQEMLAK